MLLVLHLSALRARPVRSARGSAILANKEFCFLHCKMRAPIARLASGMMLGWYATHVVR